MIEIEIPIIWNNDQTQALEELGLPATLPLPEDDRIVTSYQIDCIVPYEIEDDVIGTAIVCHGERYLTRIEYDKVKSMIKNA